MKIIRKRDPVQLTLVSFKIHQIPLESSKAIFSPNALART